MSAGPTTTVASPVATTAAGLPAELAGFPTSDVVVAGDTWLVAVADTPSRRSQGLMGVTDLGGLDGMLFVFDEEVTSSFWMKDTLIPLDIAFFAADGLLVDRFTMTPCLADPCPSYPPAGAYRWALEAPEGDLAHLAGGDRLDVGG